MACMHASVEGQPAKGNRAVLRYLAVHPTHQLLRLRHGCDLGAHSLVARGRDALHRQKRRAVQGARGAAAVRVG